MTDAKDLRDLGSLFDHVPGRRMPSNFRQRMLFTLAEGNHPVGPRRDRTRGWFTSVAVATVAAFAVGVIHPWAPGAPHTPGDSAQVARGTSPAHTMTSAQYSTTTGMGNASGAAAEPDYIAWHNTVYQVMYSAPNAPARYSVPASRLGRSLGEYRGSQTNQQPFALDPVIGRSPTLVIAIQLRNHTWTEARYAFPITYDWQGRIYHTSASNPDFLAQRQVGSLVGHARGFTLYAVAHTPSRVAIAVRIKPGVYVQATR